MSEAEVAASTKALVEWGVKQRERIETEIRNTKAELTDMLHHAVHEFMRLINYMADSIHSVVKFEPFSATVMERELLQELDLALNSEMEPQPPSPSVVMGSAPPTPAAVDAATTVSEAATPSDVAHAAPSASAKPASDVADTKAHFVANILYI